MEHVSQYYEPALSENMFGIGGIEQSFGPREQNSLLRSLLSTIDLEQLTDIFFRKLNAHMALSHLSIGFDSLRLDRGNLDNVKHSKHLDCINNHSKFADIEYGFKAQLSMRQWQVLQEFHRFFKQPLSNAIEHYKLKRMALGDFLTGLGNRASYEETLYRQISLARREKGDFGLLAIDLDNFKQINDSYGHQEGDRVLVAMAGALNTSVRDSDYLFRFGGDEFCCILPSSDIEAVITVAQRIQQEVERVPIFKNYGITTSIGATNFETQDTPQTLFNRADEALYMAKKAGRNCIKVI